MGQLAGEDTTRTKTHIVQDMQGKGWLTNAIKATRKLSQTMRDCDGAEYTYDTYAMFETSPPL